MRSRIPKLCVLTTHPIQYISPWYRVLAGDPRVDLHVIYLREPSPLQQGIGFGIPLKWDVPLRDGFQNQVLDIEASTAAIPRGLLRVSEAVRRIRPDAVMVTGWNEHLLLLSTVLLRLAKVPVILRGESNSLRLRPWYVRLFHRMFLKLASGAVVIGKANRAFYQANGVPDEKLYGGAYFVESERMLRMYAERLHERAAYRRHLGFDDTDFVFCFVGKHVPFKRPMLLVEAAARARQVNPNIRLLLAGSGEDTEALKERALALAVPVHFSGFLNQSELWKVYSPSDCFVLPSDYRETWGLVTNEAMLFALPAIVCSEVGCAPDLVHHGVTGLAFDGSLDSLTEKMLELASQPDRAVEMGRRAQELVRNQYSMPVATAGIVLATEALWRE
jgi:glycosyltransferase involved in cell wall biosynthesis